jgi:crossover junction endodeoxyribonuclease RusA
MERSWQMIRLRLPWPPSTNSIWRYFKGRSILSEKYRLFRSLAASEVLLGMKGQTPIKGPYSMVLKLDRPDRRRYDATNRIKACEDILVAAGVIEDDSLCQRFTVEWTGSIGKPAFAYVEIEEWNETASSQSANVVQMRPSRSGVGVSDKTG